jgi:hypothetical protein
LTEWQPIETAPWQAVVWVRNPVMDQPVKATRGYVTEAGVHKDGTLFTSAFTNHRFFPTPSGRLICPTEWRPASAEELAQSFIIAEVATGENR